MMKSNDMQESNACNGEDVVTHHQFLAPYPIKPTDELLILGTIHPHVVADFKTPFFYGNRNSLWNLLHEAFPEEIPMDYNLLDILRFLDERHIGMSDSILSCRRVKDSSLDVDLEVIKLNHGLVQQIKDSRIMRIYCTSGFGKNNSFKLFYEDILGLKIDAAVKEARQVTLPTHIFDRAVVVYILPSPSGAANIALSKTAGYRNSPYYGGDSKRPLYDYKVSLFKAYFKKK